MRSRLFLTGFVVAAALAAGCGGFQDPASNTNETFIETIPVKGYVGKSFNVSRNGEYFVTLNSLTPPLANNLPVEVVVTAQTSGQCETPALQIVGDNPYSKPGQQVLSGVVASGGFCLWVLDEGALQVPTLYNITVNHP